MIYLDYQATTPLAPAAREAMIRWLDGPDGTGFGNPHSAHRMGRQAKAAIELAREQVAALLPPGGRVIFTGGATEALNLAIRGSGQGGRVACSAIEHSAVGDTARAAGERHILVVGSDGLCGAGQALRGQGRAQGLCFVLPGRGIGGHLARCGKGQGGFVAQFIQKRGAILAAGGQRQ